MAVRKLSLSSQTCQQMTDLVLAYLTNKLGAKAKREFDRHLAICPDCVNFLKTYKKTVAVTKSVKPTDIPASVRNNIMSYLRKRVRRMGTLLICILTQFFA
jgi:anti-sigma factor RsiW